MSLHLFRGEITLVTHLCSAICKGYSSLEDLEDYSLIQGTMIFNMQSRQSPKVYRLPTG